MERERETTKEHTNKDAVFYFKRRRRTQARENRVHAEIEIARPVTGGNSPEVSEAQFYGSVSQHAARATEDVPLVLSTTAG
jgi:hypothetical protein